MFEKLSKRALEVIAKSAKNSQPPPQKTPLPEKLKNQVWYIWENIADSFIEVVMRRNSDIVYSSVRADLLEELGLLQLASNQLRATDDVFNYFMDEQDTDKCLTIITIVFHSLEKLSRTGMDTRYSEIRAIHAGVEKMNERFRENNVAYEFRGGSFIRTDTGFIHDEMTVPVFEFLKEPYLQGANEEFAKAHDDFRLRRYSDCLIECCKAFESTMKLICHKRGWFYEQKDTASTLIQRCKDNGLFPVFMESHISSLVTTLTSGVPTARNKVAGHGKGAATNEISEGFAQYVMNLTAANILLLVSSEKELK